MLLSGYTAETLNLERVTARGATFVPKPVTSGQLLVAVQQAQRVATGQPHVTLPSSAKVVSILVVDDDEGIRDLLAFGLRRAGFDVLEAASGEAALGLVEGEAISLVLLDIGLPGISGTDVVRALRARPQTATLPVILMTGSGEVDSLVTGLGAGADDFVAKPVRLDELVARIEAHLRRGAAWSNVVEVELRGRSAVVEGLGHLTLSPAPEEAAETVVAELARRTACDFIAVTQLQRGDRLRELATYSRIAGVRRSGALLSPNLAHDLVAHARQGPWAEDVIAPADQARTTAYAPDDIAISAGAPIYAGNRLVGLLSIGVSGAARPPTPARKAGLLAAAIDYASILSAVGGPALADLRDMAEVRSRLKLILTQEQFNPVFQPIIELGSRAIVGFEALTRFIDGTRPDLRFAEAASVRLGPDYELAAVRAALASATQLPEDVFVSLNVSPDLVLLNGRRLRALLRATPRRIILELTEHIRIDDYAAVLQAIGKLGEVGIAVDDTGAGYASLRHILELHPTFVKLDISLVRGIETDEVRQALASGLDHFALRSGCHLIAEGVETQGEATALQLLGVEFAQGFLFGRPEPIASS